MSKGNYVRRLRGLEALERAREQGRDPKVLAALPLENGTHAELSCRGIDEVAQIAAINLTNATHVNLRRNNINAPGDLAILMNRLTKNSVVDLNLASNDIVDIGANMIADMLQYNTKLHHINLDGNLISREIMERIETLLQRNRSITVNALTEFKDKENLSEFKPDISDFSGPDESQVKIQNLVNLSKISATLFIALAFLDQDKHKEFAQKINLNIKDIVLDQDTAMEEKQVADIADKIANSLYKKYKIFAKNIKGTNISLNDMQEQVFSKVDYRTILQEEKDKKTCMLM